MFLFQNEKENGNIAGDVMNMAIIFDDHLITYIDKKTSSCMPLNTCNFFCQLYYNRSGERRTLPFDANRGLWGAGGEAN